MGRFSIHHILENERQEAEVFNGRLNTNKVVVFAKTYFTPEDVDEFFSCDPEPMMLAVQDALVGLGVEDTKIHMELFTSPVGKLGQSEQTSHEVTQSEMALSSAAPLVTTDPKAPTGQSSPMMNGGTIKQLYLFTTKEEVPNVPSMR